jgi:hypothetical protein
MCLHHPDEERGFREPAYRQIDEPNALDHVNTGIEDIMLLLQ